jgi:undecaprenyl diphosphate synthase
MGAGQRSVFCRALPAMSKGVELVREMVRACLERNIQLFDLVCVLAPKTGVDRRMRSRCLMQLFVKALEQEVEKLDRNGVRLRVIGDLTRFDQPCRN